MEYLLKPVEDQELEAVLAEAIRIADEHTDDREAGEKKEDEPVFAERDCHEDAADTERSRIRLQADREYQAFIEHNYMDDISLQTVAECHELLKRLFLQDFQTVF